MKNRRGDNDRLVYFVIGCLNLFVIGMFATVLYPHPARPTYEAAVSISAPPKPLPLKDREAIVGIPNRLTVPTVGIDIDVRTGSYLPDSQSWTIEHGAAFYADRSVPANDTNGNTLIYGHAEWAVFARVVELGEGSTATVNTNEGATFVYMFESNQQVEPSDVSVLNTAGPPKLVLQTCSGPFDVYRTLVTFRLIEVIKP